MQFKHPELLYAFFLLLIPIIVHLFQLRKFKKVPFTNVAFLKDATLQTRKSSQIKKWLVLCIRLLLFAILICAFAQPYSSKGNTFKTKTETVVYLDNSFSMQAKGPQGALLKRAVQDIISHAPDNEQISLITNDKVFKNTSIRTIKNDLLQLEYSANDLTAQGALLKSKTLFKNQSNSLKNIVLISDFQDIDKNNLNIKSDTLTRYHFVKLSPVNTNNISIDSAYISEKTATNFDLKVLLKNNGSPVEDLPVSLLNNNELIAKTSASLDQKGHVTFSLPANQVINGKITIDDTGLQFDNTLFFNINKTPKINVLSINAANDAFLKRIYTDDEFNYVGTTESQLDYNLIESQHTIVLNELHSIPNALAVALKQFTDQGGSVIVVPSKDIDRLSYNRFLSNHQLDLNYLITNPKRVTSIQYAHPLYDSGVFDKKVSNFQYPKVNSFYIANTNAGAPILKYEDGSPFLVENKHVFVFTAALNNENSNFKNSPLIVPTFYNIGKYSLNIPELYCTIGKNNRFDVKISLQQDDILTLKNSTSSIIPQQRYFNNKVTITTSEIPDMAAIYQVKNKTETIEKVSYNYSRQENSLVYKDIPKLNHITISDSVADAFSTIKSDTKVNALWKWFVIFALALLITEMLILKYFK